MSSLRITKMEIEFIIRITVADSIINKHVNAITALQLNISNEIGFKETFYWHLFQI